MTSDDSDNSRGYVSDYLSSPPSDVYMYEARADYSPLSGKRIPYLEVTEQPGNFRYRYEKEKYHGHILGISSPQTKKKDLTKFPSVKIHNYDKDVIIRCWLVTADYSPQVICAHIHRLARKLPKGTLQYEPHDLRATQKNNFEVTFDYMHIVHAVMNEPNYIAAYEDKKKWLTSRRFKYPSNSLINSADKEKVKSMDKNQSVLLFQAFDAETEELLCEIPSRKIKNLHNPETAVLKIVNYSRATGSCNGGDEVFMFVEKISKDVEVRFFAVNQSNQRIWEARPDYGPQNIHHQCGIVFRTPQIPSDVYRLRPTVCIELYRKSDGSKSEPVYFTYIPDEVPRKRARSPESRRDPMLYQRETAQKKIKEEQVLDPPVIVQPSYPTEEEFFESPTQGQAISQELFGELELTPESMMLFDINSDGQFWEKIKMNEDMLASCLKGLESDFSKNESKNKSDEPRQITGTIDPANNKKEERLLSAYIHSLNKISAITDILSDKQGDYINSLKSFIQDWSKDEINATDQEGNSILLIAASLDKDALLELLENKDIDKEARNYNGDNALLCAVRSNNYETSCYLIKNGFGPNVHNSRTGDTPLHVAIEKKNSRLVFLLLQAKANPFAENFASESAFEYAAYSDHIPIKRIVSMKASEIFMQNRIKALPPIEVREKRSLPLQNFRSWTRKLMAFSNILENRIFWSVVAGSLGLFVGYQLRNS